MDVNVRNKTENIFATNNLSSKVLNNHLTYKLDRCRKQKQPTLASAVLINDVVLIMLLLRLIPNTCYLPYIINERLN